MLFLENLVRVIKFFEKKLENLNYELFDYKNYQKNQIFEMMTSHEKIAGGKQIKDLEN